MAEQPFPVLMEDPVPIEKSHSAVLIEGRLLPNKISYVVSNVQKKLSDAWTVYIGCPVANCAKLEESIGNSYPVDRSRLRFFPVEHDLSKGTDYSDLLKTTEFWDQLEGEFVLVFQTDSVFCSNSSYTPEDFFQFDYIGGCTPYHSNFFPWCGTRAGCFSNGGFSLRRRETMIEITKTVPKEPSKAVPFVSKTSSASWQEDMYFFEGTHRLGKPTSELNTTLAKYFSYHDNGVWEPFPYTMAGHKAYRKQSSNLFFKHCPEFAELLKIRG